MDQFLQKFNIAVIVIMCIILFIFAIIAVTAIRRRVKLIKFKKELLSNHLHDNLYFEKRNKLPSFDSRVYFCNQMMKTAFDMTMKQIKKKDRYDENGQLTPVAQKLVNDNEQYMIEIFVNEGCFRDGYCYFIENYKPDLLVKDFSESMFEYMSFCRNPEAFTKVVKEKPSESEQNEISESADTLSVNSDIHEPVQNKNTVTDISPKFTKAYCVDNMITSFLMNYADRLAKSKYETTDEQFEEEKKNSYNRLSKIFISGRCFRSEFIDWVDKEYPDYTVSRFNELIPKYLKYIKSK